MEKKSFVMENKSFSLSAGNYNFVIKIIGV
jgi:hypothetical protein